MSNAINLKVFYARMNEEDKEGLLEVSGNYPNDFIASVVVPICFTHIGKMDANIEEFLLELRDLMIKYFNDVEPIWPENKEGEE